MYSYQNSLLPAKFDNTIPLNMQFHSYNTWNANDFHVPLCKTYYTRQFSVYYQGPKFYDSLDSDIIDVISITSFKGAVSSIFSIIVKSQKTHFCLWKPKNNGPVVLKWVFQYTETIISMSREGWPGWKWRATKNFSSFCLMSQTKYLKTNFGLFFLLKIHLILSPCGLKAIHVWARYFDTN